CLSGARHREVKLLYWAASSGRVVPRPVLEEFRGLLVDRKATFQRSLSTADAESDRVASCHIIEYPRGAADPEIVRLGVAAGEYSRFRVDPRIPGELFERLYELWILRSIAGEMADVVLVAYGDASPARPVGLVTVSLSRGLGSIGLIAVNQSRRGQRI